MLFSLSPQVTAELKKITCPYIEPNGAQNANFPGVLTDGAWRIDTLVFDTDDFTNSDSTATFTTHLGWERPGGEPNHRGESNSVIDYKTSPTHLIFTRGADTYSINRSTLIMRTAWYGPGGVKCSISDVSERRAF